MSNVIYIAEWRAARHPDAVRVVVQYDPLALWRPWLRLWGWQ